MTSRDETGNSIAAIVEDIKIEEKKTAQALKFAQREPHFEMIQRHRLARHCDATIHGAHHLVITKQSRYNRKGVTGQRFEGYCKHCKKPDSWTVPTPHFGGQ
jgi:hypothetical protein